METTTASSSIDIVREFTETVFNGRDYDAVPELVADEYVQHGPLPGQEVHGPEEAIAVMKPFHEAFGDMKATEIATFSDGEYVCQLLRYHGTHDGDLMGIPATDVEGEVFGTVVNRIVDGKMVEGWVNVDLLGLFQQLGIIPEVDEFAA